ncbi:hypothetical protein BC939DRAFT_68624 [Gamsiella multidivaricata]|uniref:uncharacterized protein n=1 Tax=Gamsiella multidivaricata TaxID=101098 RepID=UPI00221F4440|nr:uncharacterized protein BC939DRAFT_68624 [Gamsiella multidivaricata]KAG0362968.1 hypothetical protein BGZ54_008395 [Gamsiella multidivaricata]KAI7828127.1 hypothetical protein BC939DRAFT_68624 [Gamsiella multidivaricata]
MFSFFPPTKSDPPLHTCTSPRDNLQRNLVVSQLIRVPPEILKCIVRRLNNPFDLLNIRHTSAVLFHLIDTRDWFDIFVFSYPTWSFNITLDDEPDLADRAISWKRIVLRDASLCKGLAAPLPAPAFEEDSTRMDIEGTNVPNAPSNQKDCMRLRILLNEARYFPSNDTTLHEDWHRTGASSNHSDNEKCDIDWRRTGSPVYHIDYESNTIISASMLMRSVASTPPAVADPLFDRQILLYILPDLTHPIAVCGSEFWTAEREGGRPWHHPFEAAHMQVAQVMDIRHYPDTIVNGHMRVVMVLAFGENARPVAEDQSDTQILDIWLIVRVIEIFVRVPATSGPRASPVALLTSQGPDPWTEPSRHSSPSSDLVPIKGRVETIEPSQLGMFMRGRIAKLYTATVPMMVQGQGNGSSGSNGSNRSNGASVQETLDCITLFGIQNSDSSPAVVIKKVLFLADRTRGNSSWSKKQISRGVSCMTLFPYHSNFERMLVLFNRHGRGMIWDWVNERQVAQLHLRVDEQGSAQDTAEAAALRRRLYYWGVQVSWAIEVPIPPRTDAKQRCSFRIVTLADGEGSEWESCWWHVDSTVLGVSDRDLEAPPFIPPGQEPPRPVATNAKLHTLYAHAKRYESETIGYCLPEQRKAHATEDERPLFFIAYVIWNHFRIGLTTRLGLTIFDMEDTGERPAEMVKDRQWVAFLEDTETNPLVDIATVGDNLVITRKHGHMLWSFHGRRSYS